MHFILYRHTPIVTGSIRPTLRVLPWFLSTVDFAFGVLPLCNLPNQTHESGQSISMLSFKGSFFMLLNGALLEPKHSSIFTFYLITRKHKLYFSLIDSRIINFACTVCSSPHAVNACS